MKKEEDIDKKSSARSLDEGIVPGGIIDDLENTGHNRGTRLDRMAAKMKDKEKEARKEAFKRNISVSDGGRLERATMEAVTEGNVVDLCKAFVGNMFRKSGGLLRGLLDRKKGTGKETNQMVDDELTEIRDMFRGREKGPAAGPAAGMAPSASRKGPGM